MFTACGIKHQQAKLSPKTCWADWNYKKNYYCCIQLAVYIIVSMMHGHINIKNNSFSWLRPNSYEFQVFKIISSGHIALWSNDMTPRMLLLFSDQRGTSSVSHQMVDRRISQTIFVKSFGSLNITSLMRFSCMYCGLRLYHSLIQRRFFSFIEHRATSMASQATSVPLNMLSRPAQEAK